MIRGRQLSVTFIAALLMAGGMARAQTNTSLQLNLSAPGARSLAMGGAFLGLADDATAAYTNPAGLTNLTVGGPEVAVEFRSWDYSSLYPRRGNFTSLLELGPPTGITGIGIDTISGLEVGEAQSSTRGLSFLSFGYALPHHLTLALYRHELARYQTDQVSQGFFPLTFPDLRILKKVCDAESSAGFDCRMKPSRERDDLKVENYGVSLAYDLSDYEFLHGKGSLSLGIGLSLFRLNLGVRKEEFNYKPLMGQPEVDRQPGGFFGPPDLGEDNIAKTTKTQGNGMSAGASAGFLWKIGSKNRWSLGGTFRQGPRFETSEVRDGNKPEKQAFHLPDSYGLGVAYASKDENTKVAFDYDRIMYSQRFDDVAPIDTIDRDKFRIRDADEVHVGLEQIILAIPSQFVGVLRLGAWRETAHELEYTGGITPGVDPASQAQALVNKAVYPRGRDLYHWSAGLGLVVKEDYQVDAAFERSDRVNTLSFSVVRFF